MSERQVTDVAAGLILDHVGRIERGQAAVAAIPHEAVGIHVGGFRHERTLAALEKEEKDTAALGEASEGQTVDTQTGLSASGGVKRVRAHNVKEGRIESDGSLQLSFFQLEDPLLMSLRDDLNAADLNNMTPLQAFDLLRDMKAKMGI